MRKSFRKFCIILLLMVMIVSIFVLYTSFNSENKENFVKENIYEYTNKYSYSYDISMLENNYVTNENLGDKNVYVTDLMDVANINMKYTYGANQVSNLICNYRIIGVLEAIYSKNGEEQKILKDTDVLLENKEIDVTSDEIEINESVVLNMKDKIQKIKSFQEELGLQLDTTYTIFLEINTKTDISGQEIVNIYTPNLIFEINSKTTTIGTTTENSAKPEIVTKMVDRSSETSEIVVAVATITLILASLLLIMILVKTKNSNIIKNEYKLELNRILKDCEEKIVEVNDKIDIGKQGLVDVTDFTEMIKVSEELFKPILYWNNDKEEESWFCVIGNNMIYRYILKR